MKLCSLDARSGGQSRPPPKDGGGKVKQGGRTDDQAHQDPERASARILCFCRRHNVCLSVRPSYDFALEEFNLFIHLWKYRPIL
jgi:hypothetical protein